MASKKRIRYKSIALILSLCTLVLWCAFGAGTSLAWFQDTSPEVNNIFHYADFDVELSHQLTDGSWEVVEGDTAVFDENALYEPGYVQVVYLKVENKGDVPFEFYTAININGYVTSTNVFGDELKLQKYLKFGMTISDSIEEMAASVENRKKAVQLAQMELSNYHSETLVLESQKTAYIALVVRMPEEVGNEANYRGGTIPKVELGLTVRADQIRN